MFEYNKQNYYITLLSYSFGLYIKLTIVFILLGISQLINFE